MTELEDARRAIELLLDEVDRHSDALSYSEEVRRRISKALRHDLRSRIAAIAGLTGLLLDRTGGPLTAEQEQQVQFIRQAASELGEMADDLLTTTRFAEAEPPVRSGPLQPAEVFSALRGLLTLRPPAVGLRLRFTCEDGLPSLRGDRTLLLRALRCLAYAAAVFASTGELRVSARSEPSKDAVVFDVEGDSAPGGQALLEALFGDVATPSTFQREPKPESGKSSLRQVREQVEGLGGTFVARAAESGAWTLSLQLAVTPSGPGRAEPVLAIPAADPTRWPVLVVEDDPRMLATYDAYLRQTGYQLFAARTVEEARALLAHTRPAAIVLDLVLAKETTWDFLSELKSSDAWSAIPVFVASVLTERERGLAAGADDFRIKPVDRAWLLDKLSDATRDLAGDTVLIIDDRASDRCVTRGLLAGTRFQMLEAEDGETGLRLAREEHPVAILLDLVMPGMDGFEVLEALKSDPSTRAIPVIISTASSCSSGEHEQLSKAGAVTIVAKQVATRGAMMTELGRALSRSGQ